MFLITLLFKADVDAQGGAYATGVLVLMTSGGGRGDAAAWRKKPRQCFAFVPITLVFVYTTLVNIIERPDGRQDRLVVHRHDHRHVTRVAGAAIDRTAHPGREHGRRWRCGSSRKPADAPVRIIANRPNTGLPEEYERKLREAQDSHHLSPDERVLFVEVRPGDVSEFTRHLRSRVSEVGGHHVLRCVSPAIPNAIAALLLYCRDRTGKIPHAYFGWTEGNPIVYLLKFLAFGEGDTAPVTREVLRQAEPNPLRRPRIHVG